MNTLQLPGSVPDKVSRRASIAHWAKLPSSGFHPKKKLDPRNVARRFSVRPGTKQHSDFHKTGNMPPLPSHLGRLGSSSDTNTIVRRNDGAGVVRAPTVTVNDNVLNVSTIRTPNDETPQPPMDALQKQQKQVLWDPKTLLAEMSRTGFNANSYLKNTLANANAEHLTQFNSNVTKLKSTNEYDVKYTINQSFNQVLTLTESISKTMDNLNDLKGKLHQLNNNLILQRNSNRATSNQPYDSMSLSSSNSMNDTTYKSNRWAVLDRTMHAIKLVTVLVEKDTLELVTRKNLKVVKSEDQDVENYQISNQILLNILKNDTYSNDFVINVKVPSGSFVLQTDKINEFNQLIKVINNIKTRIQKASKNRGSTNNPLTSKSIAIFNDIDDMLTNIEISIGSRKFEDSIFLIKKCELQFKNQFEAHQLDTSALTIQEEEENQHFLLKLKLKSSSLAKLKSNLINTLILQLTNYINWSNQSKVIELVEYFTILGIQSKARSIYLNLQSSKLSNLTSQLRFEVDLINYINQICLIFSNVMLRTIEEYNSIFDSSKRTSRKSLPVTTLNEKVFLLEWINTQIGNFNKLFKNQLMDLSKTDKTYVICVTLTKEQFGKLNNVGVNVDYLLDL